MTLTTTHCALFLLGGLALIACEEQPDTGVPLRDLSRQAAPPPGAPIDAQAAAVLAAPSLTGVVVETMDSGGYTYVSLDTGTEKVWAAGPVTRIAVGERVSVATGMPMRGFHSGTLNRTFDLVYFVQSLRRVGPAE